MTRRDLAALGGLFVAAVSLLVALRDAPQRAQALFAEALPAQPYFVPGDFLQLYVMLPLAVVAAVVVMLAPGVFLVMAAGGTRDLAQLVIKGTIAASLVHAGSFSLLKLFVGQPSRGAFTGLLCGAGLAAWLVLAWRQSRGRAAGLAGAADDRRRLAWLFTMPAAITVLLLPVLVWQDLNPDGLEALTTGRSLGELILPRMPTGRLAGLGLGMVTMAFPIHWFIACFGLVDAAARLPVVIYLPLLFAAILALAELGAGRRLSRLEEGVLALTLAVFLVTMTYSDTYHLYSADLASPANIDILATALMVITLLFLFGGETGWFLLAALLTYFTRPTALPLLGFTFIAVFLCAREGRHGLLLRVGAAVALCLVAGLLFDRVLPLLTGAGFAQDAASLGGRIRFLRFDDVRRVLFVVIPCGILPAAALGLWKRQDSVARVVTLVAVQYFLFFYVLAFVALHHFAPAMILPLAVYWRVALAQPRRAWLTGAAYAAGALALWLSLPRSFAVDRSIRTIGRQTVWRVGNYRGSYDEYRAAFDHKNLLDTLFLPFNLNPDPARLRLGTPWAQIHYSHHPAQPDDLTNYLGQPRGERPPAGYTLVASDSAVALYVRDLERWQLERTTPPSTAFRAPVYDIPRETLFSFWGRRAGGKYIDVKAVLFRLAGRPAPES